MTTGITIANMMPVALISICRSAKAMGPFGSSTPPQPLSIEAPITTVARKPYRMLDLARAECDDGGASAENGAGQGLGVCRRDAATGRGRHAAERTSTVVD